MVKFIKTHQSDIILVVAIALISAISFNLGKMSVLTGRKASIELVGGENASQAANANGTTASQMAVKKDPTVVASKNSKNKLYHFTWCPGASQIAEKNKITFSNEAAAITAGYTLAGNCQR